MGVGGGVWKGPVEYNFFFFQFFEKNIIGKL